MLTAISVARECHMIEKREKVVVVTTESDTAGYEVRDAQKQTLFYSYETKSVSKFSPNSLVPVSVSVGHAHFVRDDKSPIHDLELC